MAGEDDGCARRRRWGDALPRRRPTARWYAARGRIRRVDLADAAIEAALAAAWLGAGRAIGEAPGRAAAAEGAVEALAREERAGARRVPFDAGDAVPEI